LAGCCRFTAADGFDQDVEPLFGRFVELAAQSLQGGLAQPLGLRLDRREPVGRGGALGVRDPQDAGGREAGAAHTGRPPEGPPAIALVRQPQQMFRQILPTRHDLSPPSTP